MKLKRSFVLCSMLLSLLCARTQPKETIVYTSFSSNSLKMAAKIEESENVVSYETVLESYYDLAIGDSEKPTIDFNGFYDSYYAEDSDRDLYKYTLTLAEDNGNYDEVYTTLYSEDGITPASSSGGGSSGGGSSSQDADYILKDNYDYTYTPASAFARTPYYSVYDYSSVQDGDIVWETETVFFNAGHTALIVDDDQSSSSYGSYIQTVEAVGGGVARGFLDDLRMTFYKCKILRVVGTTTSKVSSAKYFAEKQLGKTYSLNTLRLNTSINSTSWYCSELVYAAWKYAGIDIGVKKNSSGNDEYLSLGCLPSDINNSYNTYQLSMPYYGFLTLSISSKSGSTWKIRIYNPSSVSLTVYYNTKMCNYDDAKEWKNLSDITSTTISSYSSKIVSISENWFATSISTSFIKGNYRIITYANNLNTNGSISTYQSVVSK